MFSMLGLSQMYFTLDVFLTNRPSLVNRCKPIPGISDQDAAVYVNSDIHPEDDPFLAESTQQVDSVK